MCRSTSASATPHENANCRGTPTNLDPAATAMRVGVVDVGANTLRLLVATRDKRGRIEPIREERRQLGLGEDLERSEGVIGEEKLEAAAVVARTHVRSARKLGAGQVVVLVTSPGRQAVNASDLLAALRQATDCEVRVLDADEEGSLAWFGAVAAADDLRKTVAVCDVGGGSAQLVVGTTTDGPTWSRSVDIGSLRLTRRFFRHDPPSARELAEAAAVVRQSFADVVPPLPLAALATGGTARALRRVVGSKLGEGELATALRKLSKRSSREIAKELDVDRARARTVTAGALILSEAQRRLTVPLLTARGGLREGAALLLLEEAAAAIA
jgi:exopolyphosphatase / guanosine-5'-triphosphate,3'-diphosphate pyrophosphatase